MTDDATLSDFATGRSDEDTDERRDADGTDGVSSLSTYAWGEYVCSRCDGAAERVWRDDGAVVCPDCKDW
ncbi:hypothetical protein EA462_00700 [Natrarchaeobius halalkaliphilus]|uniref:DUF7573 domain-containing protein n=1 Tax=Natrarchaeobius halalkaliphilus TaxID=1679091 RepID=A0A3N6MCP8_9EURY|nr:hypothetical protein [Natrarchaeobius halalkaliphilus]RQG93281.1 hypothetical protein EA462_00700 [Natrarchaeobius halalkaliphilus]